MTLYEKIKADCLVLRKEHQKEEAGVLLVVLGEAETKAKQLSPAMLEADGSLPDHEVLKIIKKNIDDAITTLNAKKDNRKAQLTRDLLEPYMPTMLTAEELQDILTSAVEVESLGSAMKYLKENYAGKYDGKVASEVARNMFA